MADLSITASQVQPSSTATIDKYFANAAITAGQTCYVSGTTAYLADADSSATTAAAVGIAVCGAAAGQVVSIQKGGTITIGAAASISAGAVYVVSDTPGGIKPVADLTSGDYVTYLGVGNASNGIVLNIHRSGIALG